MTEQATITVEGNDELEAFLEQSVREHWGDGLPIIPPTRERVERALASLALDPDHVIGAVPPSFGQATVRIVTINAIMAGCTPAMLPLVFAAIEALCVPTFSLLSGSVTTHPVSPATFISGPLAKRFGLNIGSCAFGPGNRANATIGRAISLVQLNIGGIIPKSVDHATFGHPGKYGWFFAENQDDSPFPSWAEQKTGEVGQTVITTLGGGGFLNLLETTSSADELLRVFARTMAMPNSNDLLLCGYPFLVLSPEHAKLLADAGLTITDIKQRLWETARIPVKAFSDSAQRYRLQPNWTDILGELSPETMIPMCEKPADFNIVVSGGPGRHSVYIPSGGVGIPSIVSVDKYIAG